MKIEKLGLLALAVAVFTFAMSQTSTSQNAPATPGTQRFSIQGTGLDPNGRTALWILDQTTGKIKACSIALGQPNPSCSAEVQ